jgi:hypothetical protein
LQHSLLISDVKVKVGAACRIAGSIRLIESNDILEQSPIATRQKQNPFTWNVRFMHDGALLSFGIDPDDAFGLELSGGQQGRGAAYFFLEADRATMPVQRNGFERSSIFRKMFAYHESWKQGLHKRHFGISRFCVLFVTTSAARIETMIEANKHFNSRKGSAQFLFADQSFLESATPSHIPFATVPAKP